MIEKILIAEDHDSVNLSLQKILQEMAISQVDYVYYCDDALLKINLALEQGQPYDLLVTDLYFEDDDRPQKIKDGFTLIQSVRQLQPALQILVFSAEKKATIIENLYRAYEVDGYIRKARNDFKELRVAMKQLQHNKRYLPRHLESLFIQKKTYNFSELDITIITLLANGIPQKEIPNHLKERKLAPSSLSSLEKRLNHIKTSLSFSKNEQLVAFCKDIGLI